MQYAYEKWYKYVWQYIEYREKRTFILSDVQNVFKQII